MLLVVGLGNPGKEYATTRHNAGWLALDSIAQTWADGAPHWKIEKRNKAEVAACTRSTGQIVLAKPQTFMNLSGEAVAALLRTHRGTVADLVVIHDELDLPAGRVRLSHNAGAAGHHGVESIISHLGSKAFARIRIGIAREPKPASGSDYVLQPFSKSEQAALRERFALLPEVLEQIAAGHIEKARATLARPHGSLSHPHPRAR